MALLEDQFKVVAPPLMTFEGLAVKLTVGFTVLLAEPPLIVTMAEVGVPNTTSSGCERATDRVLLPVNALALLIGMVKDLGVASPFCQSSMPLVAV